MNVDYVLDKVTVLMLNFLDVLTALQLRKRISLFFGDTS